MHHSSHLDHASCLWTPIHSNGASLEQRKLVHVYQLEISFSSRVWIRADSKYFLIFVGMWVCGASFLSLLYDMFSLLCKTRAIFLSETSRISSNLLISSVFNTFKVKCFQPCSLIYCWINLWYSSNNYLSWLLVFLLKAFLLHVLLNSFKIRFIKNWSNWNFDTNDFFQCFHGRCSLIISIFDSTSISRINMYLHLNSSMLNALSFGLDCSCLPAILPCWSSLNICLFVIGNICNVSNIFI